MLVQLLITLMIGITGAWIFYKLRIPAGAMIGAVIFVGVYQIWTGCGYFPSVIKVCVQAAAGAFIGQRINRKDMQELRMLVKPALELMGGIFFLSVCTGSLIHRAASIDMATALLSSIPGGLTDVALVSGDVGANPAQSTVLQIVRYLIAILILPQADMQLCKRLSPHRVGAAMEKNKKRGDAKSLLCTLAITTAFGAIGKISGFPAGALVFSMFAVAAYNIKGGQAYLPKQMKIGAQCLAGINIGVMLTMADILQSRELLLPALLVACNCILMNYLLGFLLYKTTSLDLATSLFASVPAGVSDMALLSLEQGGDAAKVAVLQLVRYVCVMAFMPSFIKLYVQCFPG